MEASMSTYNSLFVEIFNQILKQEQRFLKKNKDLFDLSMTEMHTLEAVDLMPGKKMREIANRLSITLSTLTTGVNNLIKKEYLTSERQREDKRVVNVFVTSKGKAALCKHTAFHDDMTKGFLSGLSDQEKSILEKAVHNICDYFKALDEEEAR